MSKSDERVTAVTRLAWPHASRRLAMLESLQTSVTGLGVVHAAGRATHADHLDGFMGGRIAPRRDIGQIGLSVHQAGDRAGECFWDLEHVQSVVACTTAEVWTGGKRANQDQGCQHQRLPSSRWAQPPRLNPSTRIEHTRPMSTGT